MLLSKKWAKPFSATFLHQVMVLLTSPWASRTPYSYLSPVYSQEYQVDCVRLCLDQREVIWELLTHLFLWKLRNLSWCCSSYKLLHVGYQSSLSRMHEEDDLGHYIKARKLLPNNFCNAALGVGKHHVKRCKNHCSCTASFDTQQLLTGRSQTILQRIKNGHSVCRRVTLNWFSYLHEEEEQDNDEDTDFRMDPGSRFPEELRVPCVFCPGVVIKERADGFPRHQLNSKSQARTVRLDRVNVLPLSRKVEKTSTSVIYHY